MSDFDSDAPLVLYADDDRGQATAAPSPSEAAAMDQSRRLVELNELIAAKKQFLLSKYHSAYKTAQQNEFLEGVLGDYAKYRDVIVAQKQQQMRALQTIDHHIRRVKQSSEFSKLNAAEAEADHTRIVAEIGKIKSELTALTANLGMISRPPGTNP